MPKAVGAKRPRKSSLTDQVYDVVKRRIDEGTYEVGQKLPIPSLIDEIGASRKPVMDAMHRLSGEGYVEILPQVGCNVADRAKRTRKQSSRLSDVAYDYLKGALVEGRLALGETINVDEYVERIGTSRQPVMDTLRRLAAEGFVNIIPQVGCRVIVPTARDILDFYRIFATTEGLCASLAAERRQDRDVENIRAVMNDITDFQNRTKSPTSLARGYRVRNRKFHQCIHEMCGSDIVTSLIENYWDLSDFYISTAPGLQLFAERINDSQDEHAEIVEMLANRDSKRIRATVEEHVMAFANEIVEASAAAT